MPGEVSGEGGSEDGWMKGWMCRLQRRMLFILPYLSYVSVWVKCKQRRNGVGLRSQTETPSRTDQPPQLCKKKRFDQSSLVVMG